MNGIKIRLINFPCHKFMMNFFIMSVLLIFSGCVVDSKQLNELTGVVAVTTPIPTPYVPPESVRLKIFTQSGSSSIGNTALTVGDNFLLRAVMVDSTGSIIKEVDVNWSVTGSLGIANLTTTAGSPGPHVTFNAAGPSTGTITATLDDSELADFSNYNVASSAAATGTITVSMSLVPDQILIVSGNNQTGQVGTNLASQLKVRVINAASTVVPGVNVTFSTITGGGTIISAQPVVTDASGEALCTVKLGGQIGASAQSFAATIPSGSSTQVSFTATGTFGPAAKLVFYQQPAGANTTSNFSTQPIVEIQDTYGNRVSNATNSITLARLAGTGAATGTLTLSAVAGLATYTNVGYDTGETGVTFEATSAGLTSGTSAAFDVGTIIVAAQCAANGAGWNTQDGGCKDLTSGLVYSAISGSTYNWHQTIWDSATSGSASPEAWEVAKGITKDQVGAFDADGSAAAYCHSLTESGISDWRVVTYAEMVQAVIAGSGAALKNPTVAFWTATNYSAGYAYYYTAQAYQGGAALATLLNARCVRRPAPTKLLITTQPAAAAKGFGVNIPFETLMVVKVTDNGNTVDASATNTVTFSHNGTGQFCLTNRTTGVTTSCANTINVNAVAGVATIPSTLTYSKAETIQIHAAAAGLTGTTSASITINQTYPWANCLSVGGTWINATGGCKSLVTGRIYSAPTTFSMTWHDAVWDQNAPGNAGSMDSDDNSRTDEYYSASGASPDNSATDYCHDLQESGQTDWKMANYNDWSLILSETPNTYLRARNYSNSIGDMLSSVYTVVGTEANYYSIHVNNAWYSYTKTTPKYVSCVRSDPPSQMIFVQQPAGHATYGFGAGVAWATQPIVEVRDVDGAPLTDLSRYNTSATYPAITLTVIGGTGNLWVGNTNYGSSYTTYVNYYGRATFSGLWYDKPNETIQLRASFSGMTWKGNAISISSIDSNNLVFPAIYGGTQCTATANWASQYGGCRDTLAGGLVWSHTFGLGITWYQAVWDSAWPGEQAQDADDGALTNHYDAAYPPGANTVNTVYTSDCHNLNLNGYTDWRMPTYSEMNTALLSTNRGGYAAIKNLAATTYLWNGSTVAATPANTYMFNISVGAWFGSYTKTYGGSGIICVRPSAP